ncbi:MAG: S41 family peptidase [Chlorobiaceae bacterium]|nr:S41 family peptidase [Chlorobiaceae bacterium]
MKRHLSESFRRGFNRWLRPLAAVSVVTMLIAAHSARAEASTVSDDRNSFFAITKSIDLFGEVYKSVFQNYVDPVDAGEFMYSGIDRMLDQLDPYSTFLDEVQSDELDELTSGRYAGIGITIGMLSGQLFVTSVFEGQAAANAGMKVGDLIVAINGEKVSTRSIDEVRKSIKGVPGSSVTLSVRKDGQGPLQSHTLTRGEIRVNTVPYSALFGSSLYVQLNNFGEHSADELRTAILTIMKQAEKDHIDLNGMVLDMRGNPGGLLNVAVDVAALFVEKGSRVVSTRGRSDGSEKVYVTRVDPLVPSLPLVVLIDGESASAAEIVSGAIQELDRGIIVGENSFGKGLVQSIIPLPYDHVLKLTTAKYYTPSGRLIQKPLSRPDKHRKVFLAPDTCDSTKAFFTVNRRKVYGGGGIRPDLAFSPQAPSEYLKMLEKEGLLFRYASRFHLRQPEFQISKIAEAPVFGEFSNFVKTEKFNYRSKPQKDLDSLKVRFFRNGGTDDQELASRFEALEQSLASWNSKRLVNDSTRISLGIRREIIRHYDQRAAMRQAVVDDTVAAKAFSLLADPKSYQTLLRP